MLIRGIFIILLDCILFSFYQHELCADVFNEMLPLFKNNWWFNSFRVLAEDDTMILLSSTHGILSKLCISDVFVSSVLRFHLVKMFLKYLKLVSGNWCLVILLDQFHCRWPPDFVACHIQPALLSWVIYKLPIACMHYTF